MKFNLKLRDEESNVKKKIIAASGPTYVVAKRKPEKFRLAWIPTVWPRYRCHALLSQLS